MKDLLGGPQKTLWVRFPVKEAWGGCLTTEPDQPRGLSWGLVLLCPVSFHATLLPVGPGEWVRPWASISWASSQWWRPSVAGCLRNWSRRLSSPGPCGFYLRFSVPPLDTPGHRYRWRYSPWTCCSQWVLPLWPLPAHTMALSDLSHEHLRPLCRVIVPLFFLWEDTDDSITTVSPPWARQEWQAVGMKGSSGGSHSATGQLEEASKVPYSQPKNDLVLPWGELGRSIFPCHQGRPVQWELPTCG
jgi:hypothetical protein